MAARINPGKLGEAGYGDGDTVTSQLYVPRNGASTVTIAVVPTTGGDARPFLRTGEGVDVPLTPDVVEGLANEINSFQINYAIHKIGAVYLQFANTSGTDGIARFYASDDAR